MEYKLISTGESVSLELLANADESLIGLRIGNSRIISIPQDEFESILACVYGEIMRYSSLSGWFDSAMSRAGELHKDRNPKLFIAMETIENPDSLVDSNRKMAMLKFFNSANVFACCCVRYKVIKNRVMHAGNVTVINNYGSSYPRRLMQKAYSISSENHREFERWYDSHIGLLSKNSNEIFKQTVQTYLESYHIENTSLSFVLLSVVLEMVFNVSNSELSYRISRGVAVFLSSDREEMRNLWKKTKELYGLRSKFVHEGRKIEDEKLFELQEIVRRVIVSMYDRGMSTLGFDFKAFREELTLDGYGR